MMRLAIVTLIAGLMPIAAQEIKLPASFEKLSSRAEEAVEVTLDKAMLKLIAKFDDGHTDSGLLNSLDRIYVRSFQFGFEDEYDKADVEALRKQFQAPQWARIVGVRSKRFGDSDAEDVDVYFKDGGNGKLSGVAIISSSPRELTFVHVAGNLDPAQIADLGGQFHIPRLDLSMSSIGRHKEDK